MNPLLQKYLLLALILFLTIGLETWFPFIKNQPQKLSHDLKNFALGLINTLITALVVTFVYGFIFNWIDQLQIGLFNWIEIPGGIEFILVIILFDLWMYVWHRLNHQVNFLWRFHQLHHRDIFLDASTAVRFHPGEIFLSTIFRIPIFMLLGMSLDQLLIYELILFPIVLFHHSNLNISNWLDAKLNILIPTPHFHRVHHSKEEAETNSNYGSIFSFWDRLGKSFRKRKDPRKIQVGL